MDTLDDDAEWLPRVGEKVRVSSTKEWASDWVDPAGQPLELWVAAIRAIPGGGLDVTISETWPLEPEKLFGSSSLSDGFIVGRRDEQDDLTPLTRLQAKAPETGEE